MQRLVTVSDGREENVRVGGMVRCLRTSSPCGVVEGNAGDMEFRRHTLHLITLGEEVESDPPKRQSFGFPPSK